MKVVFRLCGRDANHDLSKSKRLIHEQGYSTQSNRLHIYGADLAELRDDRRPHQLDSCQNAFKDHPQEGDTGHEAIIGIDEL